MKEREHGRGIQRILITGATGTIGHALRAACAARSIHAIPIQRPAQGRHAAPAGPEAILWQPDAAQPFADLELLENCDAVVHLAGANLFQHRWTDAYKKIILESRTQTTGALSLALARLRNPPEVLLSASAIGYYGSRGDEVVTEEAGPGNGFLSEVCVAWEKAAAPAVTAGIRVVHPRFGIVLTPYGGALQQQVPLFRAALGGRLGDGRQWQSWISLSDLLQALFHLTEHKELSGPVNLVAPEPVRNAEFTKALGEAVHRPAVLPVPRFALRAALGEVADEALLSSCRAKPEKLLAGGFQFRDSALRPTLSAMLAQPGKA